VVLGAAIRFLIAQSAAVQTVLLKRSLLQIIYLYSSNFLDIASPESARFPVD
jgi:hypothetical protein